MDYYSISALINAAISLLLGVFILYKNSKNKLNRIIAIWCFTALFWCFFYFLWQIEGDETRALLWTRLLMLGAIWAPVVFFQVIVIFLRIYKKEKRVLFTGYFLAVFFSILTATPLMVKEVSPALDFNYWPKPGLAYGPFLLMFFVLPIYTIYISYKSLEKVSPTMKTQIKIIIFGITLSMIGGATNYFLWYGIPIKPYGNILVSSYVIFTIYAIVKHRLMDIQIVLRKSSVYIASLVSIMILAFFTRFAFSGFALKGISWVEIFILILAIFVFPFIKNFYYRLANKYFFSSLYDGQAVIADLSEKLSSTLNINKVYNHIYEALDSAFHIKAFGVLKHNGKDNGKKQLEKDGGEYLMQFNKGFEVGNQKKFPGNKLLYKKFIAKGKPIVVEEIKNSLNNKNTRATIKMLDELGVEIITPLNVGNKTIGLIVLGKKESKDMYNDEDIQVLEIIGSQAAMAIQNAMQYEAIKNFNVRLQKEMEEATEDLRVANKKLKQLDKAKTAFLSIASHQLRAPLTAIKGFTSLLLDGSYGKLAPEKREVLKKVFDSNERLSKLTENLLNISRIESGRLSFTFEKNDIVELIQGVVDEMKVNADKSGLYLKFEHDKNIKPFVFDKSKMHEVVINLVDNAIKYTKEGGITIKIKDSENKLRIRIQDTGMGIDEEDRKNIFKKFHRGQHAPKVYTEGAGIGLYIVREILKAHNGKLSVESDGLNKGSTFIVELDKNFEGKSENGNIKEK